LSDGEHRVHPQAHVITRAVGASVELQLDQVFSQVRPRDVFLLCSDGLTGCVADDEIAACLRGPDPEAAADRLLGLALARAPADNVSLVVVAAACGAAQSA
jgi:protein phosphatase